MIPRQFLITTAFLFALSIAMSVYAWRLRRREIDTPQPEANVEHVAPPPIAGPMERVTLYVAYDDPGELRAQSISIPLASGQQRAETLLQALVNIYTAKNSPHPLATGAEVREVFLVDPGLAVVDLNSAFVDGQVSGVLAEELTMTSIIQTLSTNIPGLVRVKVLVDGKERQTLAGHADLSGFYDVQQVAEVVKELSPQ